MLCQPVGFLPFSDVNLPIIVDLSHWHAMSNDMNNLIEPEWIEI